MAQVSQVVQKEAVAVTDYSYAPPEIVSDQDREYESYGSYSADLDRTDCTDVSYDSDGNPVNLKDKKSIAPLPPVDHSQEKYAAFKKNFYSEHTDISALSSEEVAELRKEIEVQVKFW